MAIKILILEDDTNLGNSLKDFFVHQKGADVHLSNNVEIAEYYLMLDMYDLLIVDLVLPQVNGLDFLKNVISKKYLSNYCKVWCISGILDNSVLPNYLSKHVDYFFKKPLDIQKISQVFSDSFDLEKYKKYFQFFYMDEGFNLPCSDVLNQCQSISSQHLIFLYLYLFVKKFSGVLDIVNSEKNTTDKLYFEDGKIGILKPSEVDKQSYLGNLLIDSQMISSQDIKQAMEQKGNQLLGDYLVSQCLISPHIIHDKIKQQMITRLNQTIDCNQVNIRYSDRDSTKSLTEDIFVDIDDLIPFLEKWILSKVPLDWIRSFFKHRSDMTLHPSNNQCISYKQGQSKLFELVKINSIKQKISVDSLINQPVFQNDGYIYELYYRLLIKDIYLSAKDSTILNKHSIRKNSYIKDKLTKFITESKSKNYFELLSVSKGASKDQLNLNYKIAMSIFHPDHRHKDIPLDLKQLYDKVCLIINQSYNVLSDREKKQAYMAELTSKDKDKELTIDIKYKQSLELLKQERYAEAFQGFEEILKGKGHSHGVVIYWVWANLKKGPLSISREHTHKLFAMLDKLPEGLRKSDFFFVQGMLKRRSGDTKSAKVFFDKALSLNPHSVPVKQEVYSMNLEDHKVMAKKKKSFWPWHKSSA